MAGRLEGHIVRLQQMRKEILEGSGLKRPAEDASAAEDAAKRQRVVKEPSPPPADAPPLPAHRPISVAELFTLTTDQRALSMNVKAIPPDMAAPVLVNLLRNHVSREALHHAVNTVRARYQEVTAPSQPPIQMTTPLDDEDDYEPDYFPTQDVVQVSNRVEAEPVSLRPIQPIPQPVAVFQLPQPPPMAPAQLDAMSYAVADRMFENLARLMAVKEAQQETKRGFQDAVIHGAMDYQAYFRMIIRLAIRPFAGPEDGADMKSRMHPGPDQTPLTDYVRQRLLQFILTEWQRRISFAVTWFTEEYAAEIFVTNEEGEKENTNTDGAVKPVSKTPTSLLPPTSNYKRWILRFLSDLAVYLGSGKPDLRFLIRFVGEIPLLDEDILKKIAQYADDPDRVSTVGAAVRYLISYRPSVKELALDALETVWRCELLSVVFLVRRVQG